MARKVIAGLLLLVIAAWAEMTLAPLLSIHTHAAMAIAHPAQHQHGPSPVHACCPQIKRHALPLFEISSTTLPCSDQHRCCFTQGPQNAPAPARAANRVCPEFSGTNFASAASILCPQRGAESAPSSAFASPPVGLNVVLRI